VRFKTGFILYETFKRMKFLKQFLLLFLHTSESLDIAQRRI